MPRGKIGKSVLSERPRVKPHEAILPDKTVKYTVKGLVGDANEILEFARDIIRDRELNVDVAIEVVLPDETVSMTVQGIFTDVREVVQLLSDAFS